MTNKYIIYKINWRQIATHLIATIFFIQAVKQFAILNNIEMIRAIEKYGYPEAFRHFTNEGNIGLSLSYFVLCQRISALIALLIAFIISLYLTIKNKGFWQNSLIVLLTALLLQRVGFMDNKITSAIFFSFGNFFSSLGLQYKFIANGTLLISIAAFIYFSKLTRNFIFSVRQMNNV